MLPDRLQPMPCFAVAVAFLVLGAVLASVAFSSSVWIGRRFGIAVGLLAVSMWLGVWWYTNHRMKAVEAGHGASDSAVSTERLRARRQCR